ncbi:hypothetical protein STHU_17940 [Allostella humosa]|nr:hypothetical protein STHU_17940 [Stella humosa]
MVVDTQAMTAELVSVVVPLYEHGDFVEAALRSVHAQDWPEIELIVVDDASTDHSAATVERLVADDAFARRFRRLVFERNPGNIGAARTIERGLALAAGRVLTILNSDDLYAPDRLGRCVAALDAGHELVVTGVACIDRQGRPDQSPSAHRLAALPASIAAFPTASAAFLGVNRAVSTGNLLFTRDLHRRVGGFRDMPYCHDWDFVLGAMLETEPRLVDGALYRYRLHDANSFRELAPLARLEGERCLGRFFERLACGRVANPVLRALATSPVAWRHLLRAIDPAVAGIAAAIGRGGRPRGLEAPATRTERTEIQLDHLGQRLDPARETVLIVIPAADRGGRAVLALNLAGHLRARVNTVLLALADGELLEALRAAFGRVVVPDRSRLASQGQLVDLTDDVIERLSVTYVVSIGLPPHELSLALARRFVPMVVLVHDKAEAAATWTTASRITTMPHVDRRPARFLPVGPSDFSMARSQDAMRRELARLRDLARLSTPAPGMFVVLGFGPIAPGGGLNRFLAAMLAFRKLRPDQPCRFVWIGTGNAGDGELTGARETAARLDDGAVVVSSTQSNEAALRLAHAVLVTATDDLPIAMLDAMARAIPTICLADSAGADWPVTLAEAVAADPEAAGALLADLAAAGGRHHPLGARQQAKTADTRMRDHAEGLVAAMVEARLATERQRRDIRTLADDDLFDADMQDPPVSRAEAIARHVRPIFPPGVPRRPFAGFRPGLYHAMLSGEEAAHDPAAAFVRAGRPAGPWQRQVLRPALRPPQRRSGLRVGLHLHVHHDEGVADLFRRIAPASAGAIDHDLLVSTDSADKAARIGAAAARAGLPMPDIRVWPNRGRDIGPFLTGCGREWIEHYDIVGHAHAKRSPHLEPTESARWANFLFEHVLGGFAPMMGFVAEWMAADPGLGLIHPDDPLLFGWNWHDPDDPDAGRDQAPSLHFGAESNRSIAERLALRMGVGALPAEIDFPAGSMFWARSQALLPLFDLGLGWDDYPEEPVPHDGTILHALERLVPVVVESRGFRVAVTHIPGIGR